MTADHNPPPAPGILREIIECAPIRIFWKDRDSRYLGCNTLFAQDAGLDSPDGVIGRTDFEMAWREQAEAYRADDRRVMESGQPKIAYRERQDSASAGPFWLRTSKVPLRGVDGDVCGVLGLYEDVTEQHLVEGRLRESELRFRDLFERSPDPCWIMGEDNRFTFCNRAAVEQFGYANADDILARHPAELSPPVQPDGAPSHEKAEAMIAQAHRHGVHRFEWAHHRRGGEDFPAEVTLARIEFEGAAHLYCVARDITERKRADEAIHHSEQKYRGIFDEAVTAIYVFDNEKRFVDSNQAGLDLLGYSRDELLELSMPDVDADPVVVLPAHDQLLLGGRLVNYQHRLRRKDGRIVTVLNNSRPLTAPDGTLCGMQSTLADISGLVAAQEERDRLQEQLNEAKKLESVGRLAGGVAHDFNNMLSVIIGRTDLAIHRLGPDNPVAADLREVMEAARRSADLTRQLLAFARRQTTTPVVLDLNETVDGLVRMLKRLIGENIELRWTPGPDLKRIRIDPSQVDQVLANLCINARDAISGSGCVSIGTSNVTLSAGDCAGLAGAAPGDYVRLVLADDGVGIGPDVLEHIFEPFFTTKPMGKGTGLGLATVYGIVRQNGGCIDVSTHPGRGTTFRIYLPACTTAGAAVGGAGAATPDQPLRGSELVLLVEDEPAVRELSMNLLESLGYEVLAACSAAEALQLAARHADRLALLMTDVVMPGMNGCDLGVALRRDLPGLKVLLVSGYAADALPGGGTPAPGLDFLAKPFALLDLSVRLRGILDAE